MTVVSATSLGISYGTRTLFNDVSFQVGAGQMLGVAGDNGAGKTSLLRVLTGVQRPTSGQVRWQGAPLSGVPKSRWRDHCLYVPQHREFAPHMQGQDVLTLGLEPQPDRIDNVIDQLSLSPLLSQDMSTLSGGERARIFLARALISTAPLIVLDEPLAALDRHYCTVVQDIFTDAVKRDNRALVVGVHHVDDWPAADQHLHLPTS